MKDGKMIMWSRLLTLLILCIVLATPARLTVAKAGEPAARLDPPTIDGLLSESCWINR